MDILVQSRRNTKAARRFLAKLMRKQRQVPRVLVTDKLRSYGVAHRELKRSVEHRQSRHLNNRAENSHQPTRQRDHAMKAIGSEQRVSYPQRPVPGRAELGDLGVDAGHRVVALPEFNTRMLKRLRADPRYGGMCEVKAVREVGGSVVEVEDKVALVFPCR